MREDAERRGLEAESAEADRGGPVEGSDLESWRELESWRGLTFRSHQLS